MAYAESGQVDKESEFLGEHVALRIWVVRDIYWELLYSSNYTIILTTI